MLRSISRINGIVYWRRQRIADKLEGTWEEWHSVLEESERNMRAIGIEPIEVVLDIDEFEKYCAERGLRNVGGTRAE